MNRVWTLLRDSKDAALNAAYDAANVDTFRLAVTGLSRAGKTVFLVSMISNLLSMTREKEREARNSLPQLAKLLTDEKGQLRLLNIEIESTGTQTVPRFPYEALRDELARGDEPKWPPFTDGPALLALRLTVAPRPGLERAKGWLIGPRVLRLELLDYPGEWLVDLPLLESSYENWSAETLVRLREPSYAPLTKEFMSFINTLDSAAPATDEAAIHGFRLYREALQRCRDEAGFRWLQPGLFLMPGRWNEAPFLHFFPWPGALRPARGTLGHQLRERFEAYKKEVRENFFEPYFSEFNRQIVLVDVLGALFAGRTAFEETQKALASIGASYARLLEGKWLFGRKIDHVAFAATKADHVDDLQRSNLKQTLEKMVASGPTFRSKSNRWSIHVLSSIRCTTDADLKTEDGRNCRVVMGVPLGETKQRPFSPGNVPSGTVLDTYWNNSYFVMPQLRPPAFSGGSRNPIPHLHMDEVLTAVLGDVL